MLIENLEARRLLAFTATLSNGNLQVKTSSAGDRVAVHEDSGSVHVFNTDVNEDPNGSQDQFFSGVTSISFWGGTGNDTLDYKGNTIGAQIRGNAGADEIFVEDRGTGSSDVDGESDNDNIIVVHSHKTTVTGGSGNDTIQVNTGYTVDPDEYPDYISAETLVIAGSGDDVIITQAGRTTINGGAGDDIVVDAGGAATTNTYIKVETVQ